jgi:hypothetical protein
LLPITFANGLFVAVTCGGSKVITSPDGISWTLREGGGNKYWVRVAGGNGIFAAMDPEGNIMTSR